MNFAYFYCPSTNGCSKSRTAMCLGNGEICWLMLLISYKVEGKEKAVWAKTLKPVC